ncbi:unnamed protein product [Discula destructiva]
MPPRRPASRSSATDMNNATNPLGHKTKSPAQDTANSTGNETSLKDTPRSPSHIIDAILGGDPQFGDNFFGEPTNLVQPLRPAPGEAPLPGEGSAHTMEDHSTPAAPALQRPYTNMNTIESNPMSIDALVIQQLQEDLAAYRADLEFCRAQLDPHNAANITAAESRTFQLRILDLGHQMRMVNHRVQLMQLALNNGGRQGPATAAANAYWGAYPPGTNIQQAVQGPPAGMSSGYYGQGAGPMMAQSSVAYQYPGYSEQERRRPGRPLGSKNRAVAYADAQGLPPGTPAGGGSSTQATALASAAALAAAGAKRRHSLEIHVATPNGDTPSSNAGLANNTGEQPSKRMRLNKDDNTELDEKPTMNEITAVGNNGHYKGDDEENMTDEDMHRNINPNVSLISNGSGAIPHSSALASPYGARIAPVPHRHVGTPGPEAPAGDTYQRLGYWRCRLCTSQKYLNAPPPKQPSEPGTWPLRDVSKMVTHFTRMHGEHNNVERCMELGAALGENKGPFRHWLTVTKKEKGLSVEAVAACVDELENGKMPALLRKVSMSAASFPKD